MVEGDYKFYLRRARKSSWHETAFYAVPRKFETNKI